ncbi:hypothetical protein FRC03_002709 [Tulasnella sp. 419]|nr:hypothetical protein FRC02_007918 [Tulasnella sp. 418]KAG8963665.1 hypothetical protein FRC03_002709 [Tulasnella sp. 419]
MGDEEEAKAAYEKARSELISSLQRKRQVDRTLALLEQNLFQIESSYLTETAGSGGNIISGFDGYLKGGSGRKKQDGINSEQDRVFSNSSSTYLKSLELSNEPETPVLQSYPQTASIPGITTVSLQPTDNPALRRESRIGRGQRKRTEDPEVQPPSPVSVSTPLPNRPGRPNKRQRLNTDD